MNFPKPNKFELNKNISSIFRFDILVLSFLSQNFALCVLKNSKINIMVFLNFKKKQPI